MADSLYSAKRFAEVLQWGFLMETAVSIAWRIFSARSIDRRRLGDKIEKLPCGRARDGDEQVRPILENSTACTMSNAKLYLGLNLFGFEIPLD